jgi:hypothetical protein
MNIPERTHARAHTEGIRKLTPKILEVSLTKNKTKMSCDEMPSTLLFGVRRIWETWQHRAFSDSARMWTFKRTILL